MYDMLICLVMLIIVAGILWPVLEDWKKSRILEQRRMDYLKEVDRHARMMSRKEYPSEQDMYILRNKHKLYHDMYYMRKDQ